MMGDPTEEWDDPPYPGLVFFQTPTQEFLQTDPINEDMKKVNAIIMRVGDTILDSAAEVNINENWCLLDNQSAYNTFVNGKYLSNIRDAPIGKYIRVYCNAEVTHTNQIDDLPGYSDPVWYNPKGMSNVLYLGLIQNNPLVT